MYLFKRLNQLIKNYLPKEQIILLKQVYYVARDAHKEQIRSSGEPYITHPVAVACILAQMKLDYETLTAALLHDVIEDTTATYQDMKELFGEKIAKLIEGVSKLDKLQFRDKKEAQAENFRKMVIAMVRDIRVILIKLADRTHNMRTLHALPIDKKRRIALETLEIYSPLAHRLGIYYLKTELEELSFKTLYPKKFKIIKESVHAIHSNKKKAIQSIIFELDDHLQKAGFTSRINGCIKSFYEIFSKIYLKKQCINTIMDIYAFHIIVKDPDTCYRVLSKIHNLYKPIPGRLKDYITMPKINGYQSLHTSMIGPYGIPVAIQIRTEDMDQMAKIGVAAHWNCKEHKKNITTTQIHAQRWLQRLQELQQNTVSSFEFIESVKSDLFDEFYVFTPKGRIIKLPSSSVTSVDFTYTVHADIGDAYISKNLKYQDCLFSQSFISSQNIRTITDLDTYFNLDKLHFIINSKDKTKIHLLLKIFNQEESTNLGHSMLSYVLRENQKLNKIVPINNLQLELNRITDELLIEVGLGNIMKIIVAKNIIHNIGDNMVQNNKLFIKGIGGETLITFTKCYCYIPCNHIVACINPHPNKGVIIHYTSRRSILSDAKEPKKIKMVKWNSEIHGEFISAIKVDMINHQNTFDNLIAAMNTAFSRISSINIKESSKKIFSTFINLTVNNKTHLS